MSPKNANGPFILPDPSVNTSMLHDPRTALKTQFKQDLVTLQHFLDTNRSIQTPTTTVTADNHIMHSKFDNSMPASSNQGFSRNNRRHVRTGSTIAAPQRSMRPQHGKASVDESAINEQSELRKYNNGFAAGGSVNYTKRDTTP